MIVLIGGQRPFLCDFKQWVCSAPKAPSQREPQTVEKASQSFLRKQKIKLKTFSAGACTWQKILLRLPVRILSAISRQMMREADCKELAERPEGDFRQAKAPSQREPFRVQSHRWNPGELEICPYKLQRVGAGF